MVQQPEWFVIWGGEGERENESQSNQGNNQSGDTGKPGDGNAGPGDDGSDVESRLRDLETKLDAEKKARIAEKKRADKAETDLTAKNQEGQEEAERTASERDDFKAKYEKLLDFVETSYIDTAIMKNKKYDWHDVEAVRTFLNKDSIRLDMDTGEIEGLDLELKRLAAEKKWLLVQQGDRDSDQAPPAAPPGTPPTGSHPVGGTTRQRETDRNKLGAKYKLPGFGPGAKAM